MSGDEFGVFVEWQDNGNQILVSGNFRLPAGNEHHQFDHAALVMVVSHRAGYKVVRPLKEKVLFEDDLTREESSVAGRFALDFQEHTFEGIDRYHVLFSMGGFLSSVLDIIVTSNK